MFTGLIEEVGRLKKSQAGVQGFRLEIEAPAISPQIKIGDSVAVNGVCQTVIHCGKTTFQVEAVGDTLKKTTLGSLAIQSPINLERALRVDGRLDGHLVSGHVNAQGKILSWMQSGMVWKLILQVPREIQSQILCEGSLSVEGISLTISSLHPTGCTLNIIPHTRENTSLKYARIGQRVNLETDLLMRNRISSPSDGLNMETLRTWGY